MHAVVTGCAGFIGSTLVDALLAGGHSVVGVDCFTDYYDPGRKRANLATALLSPSFALVDADVHGVAPEPVLGGADVVFHLAAQPGVRLSWSSGFAEYVRQNVLVTQRLLEAAVAAKVPRFVLASSSSVYGQAPRYPTTEDDVPRPHSPYGVTKLAAEHLARVYGDNHGLWTMALRYFTVYGPRQRPDMALHRMLEAARTGDAFPLYGDGSARRDFTFVDDVVAATIAAATCDAPPGEVVNIAGGAESTVAGLLDLVGEVVGAEVPVRHHPPQAGDVDRTGGAIQRARRLLGWEPAVGLREGVAAQASALARA